MTATLMHMVRGEPRYAGRTLGVTAATARSGASDGPWRPSRAQESVRRAARRRDGAAAGEDRRDPNEQRVTRRTEPPAGGQRAFTSTEGERRCGCRASTEDGMSNAVSVSGAQRPTIDDRDGDCYLTNLVVIASRC